MTAWRLAVADTHLYPGARLRCLDTPGEQRMAKGDAAILEFSDGCGASARIEEARSALVVLSVDGHTTARGAAIAAKRWHVAPGASAGELKVRARAA